MWIWARLQVKGMLLEAESEAMRAERELNDANEEVTADDSVGALSQDMRAELENEAKV